VDVEVAAAAYGSGKKSVIGFVKQGLIRISAQQHGQFKGGSAVFVALVDAQAGIFRIE
jgi:hypothetical protein